MTKTTTNPANCEISRRVAVDTLGNGAVDIDIAVDSEERAALARRFALVALDSLSADVRVKRGGRDGEIYVTGKFSADVVQRCVVTLDPVTIHLAGSFTHSYCVPGHVPTVVEVDPEGEDSPEPLVEEWIDIGAVVAEQLALNLDPYPRAPGVVFSFDSEPESAMSSANSPFVALRGTKMDQ